MSGPSPLEGGAPRLVVAVDGENGERIVSELADERIEVIGPIPADSAAIRSAALTGADALLVSATRAALDPAVIDACDRQAVRIIPLAGRSADSRRIGSYGLADPLAPDAPGWQIADAVRDAAVPSARPSSAQRGRITAVWGPGGAPGRTTLAIELAVELARCGRRTALVDADAHAPSVALALGLADETPGFAAACRQAELGTLDPAELDRVSIPLGAADAPVDVLTGINRASRWPELSAQRVAAALDAARDWSDEIVVDVAAPLENDEEIVSDLDGPRRNAATLAALETADRVVAVAGADPVGVARFLRGHSELRRIAGEAPVDVVVNKLRTGALGIDARGQVRRTLERFAGIAEVSFVPSDTRAADAALLAARPVGEVAARSGLSQAVRRLAQSMAPDETSPGRAGRPRRGRTGQERRGRGVRRRRAA